MEKNKFLALLLITVVTLSIIIFPKVTSFSPKTNSAKIQVVASFYPLYFFASQIGGDKAEVTNITPAGAEPHDYEPSPQQIAGIEKSDLLILSGGKLEPWGEKIKSDLNQKNTLVVTAGEGLSTGTDPHIWLSPSLAKKEVEQILQGFVKIDPLNNEYYEKNAASLNATIGQLDQEYKQQLSRCTRRDFVVSHAAFSYLAKAYNLNQIAISGLSPDEEPSSKQLAEIANFAKGKSVKYIFFESLVSPKLAQTIAEEIQAKTLVLDPIEGISDSELKKGTNYFTIMTTNLNNLIIALECK